MTKRKIQIIKLNKIDSTNTYLRQMAENGADEGCIVIANEQTSGRGRRGRSLFSPADTGLYMSMLIRPEFSVEDSLFITSMTSVATARAIESVTNVKCGIKWVNDIYIGEKKVSGILCEGSFDHDAHKVNYIVVGIGINITTPESQFPEELRHIATSLGSEDIKEQLMRAVCREFFELYDRLPEKDYLTEYKERSVLMGKRIEVLGNNPFFAKVLDIDDSCRLVVEDDRGAIHTLSSGEVSTRITR